MVSVKELILINEKMNKQEKALINAGYKLLDNSFNIKTNVIKINVGNTLEHEMAKLKKSYELVKGGKTIITEAIFKTGGRADIFNLTDLQVFEILHSEREKEALIKTAKYPEGLDIFYLKSSEVLK